MTVESRQSRQKYCLTSKPDEVTEVVGSLRRNIEQDFTGIGGGVDDGAFSSNSFYVARAR
ncbi:hypothetical protein KCP70_03035 [Salmonella enterica subsp. enterica]|nr:hypothetical protein KCP70_03035 [Salmonella enterica subsp. enterica]